MLAFHFELSIHGTRHKIPPKVSLSLTSRIVLECFSHAYIPTKRFATLSARTFFRTKNHGRVLADTFFLTFLKLLSRDLLCSEPFAQTMDDGFFEFLAQLDCSDLRLFAQLEGTVVFPRVPLLRVEGPLIIAQLVETPLLTLVNYASLVATNAMRHRLVAGDNITLLEFGLRRAQGPDGGKGAQIHNTQHIFYSTNLCCVFHEH